MSPEDWRFLIQTFGVPTTGFVIFVFGLRRKWWVMGSEVEEINKRAELLQVFMDKFVQYADRAILTAEVLARKDDP